MKDRRALPKVLGRFLKRTHVEDTREMDDAARFSIVEKLVGLSRADWKYADLYVREAEAAMAPLCT